MIQLKGHSWNVGTCDLEKSEFWGTYDTTFQSKIKQKGYSMKCGRRLFFQSIILCWFWILVFRLRMCIVWNYFKKGISCNWQNKTNNITFRDNFNFSHFFLFEINTIQMEQLENIINNKYVFANAVMGNSSRKIN